MLGPDAIDRCQAIGAIGCLGQWQLAAAGGLEPWLGAAADRAIEHVHRRRADEARHEQIVGAVIKLEWCAHLLDDAVMQHDDLVGHGHGFHLVMRHIDGGGLQPLMQFLDFGAHLHAQFGIEIGQRLIEQEDFRIADDGPAHGDTLALAARQLTRIAGEIGNQPQNFGRLVDPGIDLGFRCLPQFQRETHVLGHRLVRIKRIVLEHHGDIAVFGLQAIDDAVADHDIAAGDLLKPGDHPEQRGLAAARWPDQGHELAIGNIDCDTMDDFLVTIGFSGIQDID